MASGVIIHNVNDALAAALQILESAQEEIIWLSPASLHSLSMTHGFYEKTRAFVERGGVARGIVPISRENVEEIRMSVKNGEDIRHSEEAHEVFMYVGDKRQSVSAINIGVSEFTLATTGVAFWSESPTYAEYLLASFENVWSRAVPAEEWIQELLGQGAGQH